MARPLAAVAVAYRDGQRIPRHRHREAHLIAAISGVMTVTTREGRFVVPPQRAVWVPRDGALIRDREVAAHGVLRARPRRGLPARRLRRS
jgi:ribosomal protein L35AE/L33A